MIDADAYDWKHDPAFVSAVAADAFVNAVDGGGHGGDTVMVRVRVSHDGTRVGDVYETVLSEKVTALIGIGYIERVWPDSGW